jgi:hypothetical protein
VYPTLVRLPRTCYPARAQHPLAPPRHLCLSTRVPDHSVRSLTVRGACGTLICRLPDQEEEACCRRVRAEAAEECDGGARWSSNAPIGAWRGSAPSKGDDEGAGRETNPAAARRRRLTRTGDDEDNALAVAGLRSLQRQVATHASGTKNIVPPLGCTKNGNPKYRKTAEVFFSTSIEAMKNSSTKGKSATQQQNSLSSFSFTIFAAYAWHQFV